VALRDERLGDFGGATPDPAVDRHLAELGTALRGGGFAFGAALDGDGDRVRFADETGRPLDNGTVLALLGHHLLDCGATTAGAAVVYDQKTRLAVVGDLQQAGLRPVRERSGHSFMRARMLAEQAVLGGENSGHFFWGLPDLYPVAAGDCGLFAVFALAGLLRRAGRPLSELAARVPGSPFYTGDIRGLRYAGDREALLATVAGAARRAGLAVDTADGVRLERPGAFAHLRASVTEADMLTAALDALDAGGLQAMAEELEAVLPADAHEIAAAVRQRVADLAG
jgi:phosphomannomutase